MVSTEYCAVASSSVDESIAGTATADIDAWIALEICDAWAPKVIESEVLAGERRSRIEGWLKGVPRSRLQLVRHPKSTPDEVSLFLASSVPGASWAARIRSTSLDEVCALDVPALFLEQGGAFAQRMRRLFLICTHGKRDRCCAKFGTAVFADAFSVEPDSVWQTSHLGGHRFAATALSLPTGICYGRLGREDVVPWLAAEARGEIFDVGKVRGRTAYSRHVQAAEILAWKQEALARHDALQFLGEELVADERWSVRFRGERDTVIDLRKSATGTRCLGSCGDDEPRAVFEYVLAGTVP